MSNKGNVDLKINMSFRDLWDNGKYTTCYLCQHTHTQRDTHKGTKSMNMELQQVWGKIENSPNLSQHSLIDLRGSECPKQDNVKHWGVYTSQFKLLKTRDKDKILKAAYEKTLPIGARRLLSRNDRGRKNVAHLLLKEKHLPPPNSALSENIFKE